MNTENNLLKGPMTAQTEGVEVKTPEGTRTMTMEEVMKEDTCLQRGIDMANMMVAKALDQKDPPFEFMALRYMAIHILGGQIFNTGMNSEAVHEGRVDVSRWDASRAFAAEKDVQEHLSANVTAWKGLMERGELKFSKSKFKES